MPASPRCFRARSTVVALLLTASVAGGCTRSFHAHPRELPHLLAMRADRSVDGRTVATVDGDQELVRSPGELRILPPEGAVFMSSPDAPGVAVPVAKDLIPDLVGKGWRRAPRLVTSRHVARMDGERLVVAELPFNPCREEPESAECRRYREHGAFSEPIAFRTRDIRGVAVEVPRPGGQAATAIGIALGAAALIGLVVGGVALASSDGCIAACMH